MSWLGLLLVGMAVADLVFSVRPMRHVPEAVGASVVVALGLVAGLTGAGDVLALVVIAALVVVWGQTVTAGFRHGGRAAWFPLAVGGVALLGVGLVSGLAGPADGLLERWLQSLPYAGLADLPPEEFLLVLGVLLFQLSSGNVVVRLVLAATGSRNPSRLRVPAVDHGQEDERPLKGGRLLGPMERLLIVGLGIAGEVTAASVVIAAKGLLRFPELQAAREEGAPGIHEVTEYFLVGSFTSWLVSLGGLVLLAS